MSGRPSEKNVKKKAPRQRGFFVTCVLHDIETPWEFSYLDVFRTLADLVVRLEGICIPDNHLTPRPSNLKIPIVSENDIL